MRVRNHNPYNGGERKDLCIFYAVQKDRRYRIYAENEWFSTLSRLGSSGFQISTLS
jgi:hypothetical protein